MSTPQTIKPMQVMVNGRVESVRLHDGTRYTRVITPSADAYSRPQTVEIRSKQPLGPKGEEIKVVAALGGFTRKPFRATDKATGETMMVTPVDMTLDAIE